MMGLSAALLPTRAAGAFSFALSSAVHTEPILSNVLSCVRCRRIACAAVARSLRSERLHREAAYPLEALGELRTLRLAARDAAAPVALEVSRAACPRIVPEGA